jgi:hypothetical protein
MRAAKAKAAVLHPKAKVVEVAAKEKAPDLLMEKAEDGIQTLTKPQHPRPSPHSDPSKRKVRPPRKQPRLTRANAATVASTATKLETAANVSMRNQWLPWRVLGRTGPVLHSTHFFSGTMVLWRVL